MSYDTNYNPPGQRWNLSWRNQFYQMLLFSFSDCSSFRATLAKMNFTQWISFLIWSVCRGVYFAQKSLYFPFFILNFPLKFSSPFLVNFVLPLPPLGWGKNPNTYLCPCSKVMMQERFAWFKSDWILGGDFRRSCNFTHLFLDSM